MSAIAVFFFGGGQVSLGQMYERRQMSGTPVRVHGRRMRSATTFAKKNKCPFDRGSVGYPWRTFVPWTLLPRELPSPAPDLTPTLPYMSITTSLTVNPNYNQGTYIRDFI